MSIKAIGNLIENTWEFESYPEFGNTLVQIGFKGDSVPVVFNGLSFGFSCESNGEIYTAFEWPEKGVVYSQSDEETIAEIFVSMVPDKIKQFTFWAENDGVRFSGYLEVVGPIPPKPFNSWDWIDGSWKAPVPYPSDGNFYNWDEEKQQWIIIEDSNYEVQ
jgi:hypothetical protein